MWHHGRHASRHEAMRGLLFSEGDNMSEEKFKCRTCEHITTPNGKQCYTLSRCIKEEIRDKQLPFYPQTVNPIIDAMSQECKRYKPKDCSFPRV